MNINELRSKLKPTLKEYVIEGFTLYVHRPAGRDFEKCTNIFQTVIYCVKDENGDSIFSDEDVEGRINVHSIDYLLATKIAKGVFDLMESSDEISTIEKK